MSIIEYLTALLFAVAVSIGVWMCFECYKLTKVFRGRINWTINTLAGVFSVCPAAPWLISWRTGDYSLFPLFAIFALLASVLWVVFNIFYYRGLREKIPGKFSGLQFIWHASPFIIFFPIVIAVVLLYPPKGIVELFLLTAGPISMLFNGWVTSLNYGIQRHIYWKLCAIDSVLCCFWFLVGGLCFLLGYPEFILLLPFIFALPAAIGHTFANRKLFEMAHSPPPAAEVIIGNELVALGEFSELTNRLLVRITPEAGKGTTERILAKHFEAGDILKGCELKEGRIDMHAAVKNIQRIPRKERMQRVFESFHRLHLDLIEAHAVATSRNRAKEIFNKSFALSASKYGEPIYRYGLPMLLSQEVLEPALEKCKKSTLKSLRLELEGLKREDPLLEGLKLGDNRLNLEEFYSEISKLPTDKMIPSTISVFSNLMSAWYPLIRKDLGKKADELFLSAFSDLIKRHPLMLRFGLLEIPPEGVELPGLFQAEFGKSCLVEGPKPTLAFEIFEQVIKFGMQALCVSSTYPNDLRRRYKLGNARVIWLSRQDIKNSVSPADLDVLRDTIVEFTKKQRGGVVLLDGLEHLTITNGFDQVLRFLHDIQENVAVNRVMLLVPINPDAFDGRQLALLRRDMELVRKKAK